MHIEGEIIKNAAKTARLGLEIRHRMISELAILDLLYEKNIFTKEEFNSRVEEIEKYITAENKKL